MPKNTILYAAIYPERQLALDDLDAFDRLRDEQFIGEFDAAVVAKENGRTVIVKRMDRPRRRLIPELVGGGTLPRKELKEAAQELSSGDAGLIVVGEPTFEEGFDKAVRQAAKVVKHSFDASMDEVATELVGAFND